MHRCVATACLYPAFVWAQEVPVLSWVITGDAFVNTYSSDRYLTDRPLSTLAGVHLDVRRSLEGAGKLAADVALVHQTDSEGQHTQLRPRNVTWANRVGTGDLMLGWMQLNLGKADAINPSDFFVTYDYTLLQSNESDWRNARLAATYRHRTDEDASVSFIVAPVTKGNTTPFEPLLSRLPRSRANADTPEVALRYETEGTSLDWSVTAFDGVTKDDVLLIEDGLVKRGHTRLLGLGADAAGSLGPLGWKLEVAYHRIDVDRSLGVSDFFFGVAGLEKAFDNLNAGVQLIYKRTPHWHANMNPESSPLFELSRENALNFGQMAQEQMGASGRLSWHNLSSPYEAELFVLRYQQPAPSTYLRTNVGLRLAQRYKLSVGMETYAGPTVSDFGRFKANRAAYIEFRGYFE